MRRTQWKKLASFRRTLLTLPAVLLLGAGSSPVAAQCQICTNEPPKEVLLNLIETTDSEYLTQSPQNLQMMPTNPAYFTTAEGEGLFRQKRGPENASLEGCDLGLGPGVVEGAYAKMPRYFPDADRVMDLESRLLYCMKTVQGFSEDAPEMTNRGQLRALQTYIGSQSNGYEWDPPMDHPLEKAMRDAGEAMFYRRASKLDFSCNTCHGETGKRVRASVLPNMNVPEEWTKAVSWPATRVGKHSERTSYQRARGCYWQMRKGEIQRGSDAYIALISFWTDAARGQPAILPDLKR